MEKDKIFFGEQGLTLTSANHIANLAKEYYQTYDSRLQSMTFYNKTMSLLDGSESHLLSKGWDLADLDEVEGLLDKLVKYKSLIAWLREAIKAHERMRKEIENLSVYDYCSLNGIEEPLYKSKESSMTEADYVATMSVKDRNRYYALETACAVLGEYIHPNGKFHSSREDLKFILSHPCDVSGSGKETILYKSVPSVNAEKVDECFYAIYAKYRECQAELNGIKNTIQSAVRKDAYEKQVAYNEWNERHTETTQRLRLELERYQKEELKRVSKLKIIIPNDLKEAYDEINTLGK